MSIKKILAFVVLVLVVILITAAVFFSLKQRAPEQQLDQNGFPIGGDNGSGLSRGDVDGDSGFETNVRLTDDGSSPSTQTAAKKAELRLRKVYDEPVAGGTILMKKIFVDKEEPQEDPRLDPIIITEEVDSYEIIFTDRKNGHLILDKEYESEQETLTNTTILQVYESEITDEYAVLRYLDQEQENIQTFVGTFAKPEEKLISKTLAPEESTEKVEEGVSESLVFDEKKLEGSLLPENILSLSISPDGTEFIYSLYNGSTEVRRAPLSSPNVFTVVYTSLFKDVYVDWNTPNTFLMQAKADSRTPGFVEEISLSTGSRKTIASGESGLIIKTDSSGTTSLKKNSVSSRLVFRGAEGVLETSFSSLPEKCIWSNISRNIVYCGGQSVSPRLSVPEAWYQGNFSYVDSLYKLDLSTNSITEVLNTSTEGVGVMDIVPLSISEDDSRLLFLNKTTLEPWILKLNEPTAEEEVEVDTEE